MHPKYLGFQVDWPVFVKVPFKTGKHQWQQGDHFNWAELGVPEKTVAQLYAIRYIYHSDDLELKHKVGFGLSELNKTELRRLIELLNKRVKERTDSKEQYNKIRCRLSTNFSKQRTLLRRFLHNNPSFEEDYYEIYDYILGKRSKPVTLDGEEEQSPGPTTTQTSQQEPPAEDSTQSDSSSETLTQTTS